MKDSWVGDHQLTKWREEQLTATPDMYQIHAMVDELLYYRQQQREIARMAVLVPEQQLLAIEAESDKGPFTLIVKQLKLFAAEIRRLQRGKKLLADALRAVLLFHHTGPWRSEEHQKWSNLTGHAEATSKNLCDLIRARLEEESA